MSGTLKSDGPILLPSHSMHPEATLAAPSTGAADLIASKCSNLAEGFAFTGPQGPGQKVVTGLAQQEAMLCH
jgi:hypothetical protein